MRSFSKKLAFVLAAAMVFTAFAPAAKAEAAAMKINKSSKILYVTDGEGINDAAQVGGGKGNVAEYDFSVSNKPKDYKKTHTFEWSSSDEDVIEVGKAGLTKAVGVGVADVVCVVTEKATGKATTLKSEVTVKANAAEVVITNADDYADLAYEVGAEIDLNRAMYNADGVKAPKRGVVVTDYTRWMVEPSAGVKVTQSNGKYVFTDAAEAGTYKLWCETYQSSKYTKTTAKSQVIEVELVKEKTFEVAQTTTKKFTVNFSQPVSALASADVTVARLFGTYEYNSAVKSVKLADDKLSATVELYDALQHQKDYKVTVKGFEDTVFNASAGKPVDMDIIALDGNGNPLNPTFVLTTKSLTNLQCVFYDEKGVEVERSTNNVVMSLEKNATNGDYYLAGTALRINKSDVSVVVKVSYQGWAENGKRVGQFERTQEFFATDAAPINVTGVSDYTLDSANNKWGGSAVKSMEVNQSKTLHVRLTKTDGQNAYDALTAGSSIAGMNNTQLTFTSVNPKVAIISNAGLITAFQPGVAEFYVNVKNIATGAETPFAVVSIEVKGNSDLSYITVNNGSTVIGTDVDFCTGEVLVLGYSQYDALMNNPLGTNVTVKCLTNGYGAGLDVVDDANTVDVEGPVKVTADGSKDGKTVTKLTFDAKMLRDLAAAYSTSDSLEAYDDSDVFALDYRVTFQKANGTKLTADFTIVVQETTGNSANDYLAVTVNKDNMDATRNKTNDGNGNTEAVKTVEFSVFKMNNGVKVEAVTGVEAYSNNPTSSKLYYKILKDGQDLNGGVTVTPTANKFAFDLSNEAPSNVANVQTAIAGGKIVNYNNVGAGTYTFILFKYSATAGYQQDCTATVSVSASDAGAYTIAGDMNAIEVNNVAVGSYSTADAEKIVKCFNINDKNGKNVLKYGNINYNGAEGCMFDKIYVDYTATTDFVYVNGITFYERVADNATDANDEYVAYNVDLDVALRNKH